MKTIVSGWIEDFVPKVSGYINDEGILVLKEANQLKFTVDTGFSAGISLPKEFLDIMDIEPMGYEPFELATGKIIELPVFVGTCIVNDFKVEARFISGDFLIGMEFMTMVSSRLILDFENEYLIFQKE